jgi:DNA-binding transcriptional regulator YiaG
MATRKTERRFVYEGFGFPVVLRNVPMIKVRGAWTPLINYSALARAVLVALAHKPARLTGHEIRFIRQHFEMTLEAFGARLDVSHPAVLKWERAGDKPPAMKWPVEKDLRLFILDALQVRPADFKELYETLREPANAVPRPLELDAASAA